MTAFAWTKVRDARKAVDDALSKLKRIKRDDPGYAGIQDVKRAIRELESAEKDLRDAQNHISTED